MIIFVWKYNYRLIIQLANSLDEARAKIFLNPYYEDYEVNYIRKTDPLYFEYGGNMDIDMSELLSDKSK